MRPRLVLLDVVGTLMTVRGGIGGAYAERAARHGVRVDGAALDDAFAAAVAETGWPTDPGRAWWRRVVGSAFERVGARIAFDDFEAFFDDLFAWFATAEPWHVYPDTRPALESLRAEGVRLGVASNFDRRLPAVLEATGLAGFFDGVTLPADAGAGKPDPALFERALALHGVRADEAWHVGDHAELDVAGAEAAGLTGVLVDREAGVDLLAIAASVRRARRECPQDEAGR
ncbi:MAG: HAD-IA family hydrolase [Myxococcota bacterium]